MAILPSTTCDDFPQLYVICVPGGPGQIALMDDDETLDFLRRQAETAQWITSVCTGSLVLGAAGLPQGYRATTHWASHDQQIGRTPCRARRGPYLSIPAVPAPLTQQPHPTTP